VGKIKYLIIAFVVVIPLGVVGYFLSNYLDSKAALLVESEPSSIVYLDGKQVGKTPYEGELDEREVTLKLVPESFDVPLLPYETKVSLTKGVRTVVRRKLGDSRQTSSGEIISFEHIGGDSANVSVITTPDGSEVFFDSGEKEFSPARFTSVSNTSHDLEVKAQGYLSRKFEVLAESGYNLTAIVELPRDPDYKPDEELKTDESNDNNKNEKDKIDKVTIMETPTGFLRVRSGPNVTNDEVGRVTPGKEYEVLSVDKDTGWYEISFDDESGWVTDAYATPSAKTSE